MTATVNDFNLSYIGNGPSGSGQNVADQTSGPKAKTLYGYGVLKAAGTTGTTITSSNVGWIDGVQTLGKTIVLKLQAVAASDGTNAVYSCDEGVGQLAVGDLVTIAGFATSANNVSGAAVAGVTGSSVSVANASAVAETNPAATLVNTKGGVPKLVNVFLSPASTDTNGLATARAAAGTYAPVPSAITATGCVLNYSALATTGNSVTVGFVLEFAS